MNIRTRAVGEVVVSIRALVAVEAVVVGFTGALSAADLTDLTLRTIHMTLARHAARIAVVAHVTPARANQHTPATIDHFTNTLYILWIALGIFGVTHHTRCQEYLIS